MSLWAWPWALLQGERLAPADSAKATSGWRQLLHRGLLTRFSLGVPWALFPGPQVPTVASGMCSPSFQEAWDPASGAVGAAGMWLRKATPTCPCIFSL